MKTPELGFLTHLQNNLFYLPAAFQNTQRRAFLSDS